MDAPAGDANVTRRRNVLKMKRVMVILLGSMLLIVGAAGCGSTNGSGSGSGTTSSSPLPGY
jgi:hypothetical protein